MRTRLLEKGPRQQVGKEASRNPEIWTLGCRQAANSELLTHHFSVLASPRWKQCCGSRKRPYYKAGTQIF